MHPAFCTFFNFLLATVLILATASLGIAHKSAPTDLDPYLTAYLQAGGSLSDICGDLEGDPHRTTRDCDACRLMDGALAARNMSEFRLKVTAHIQRMRLRAQLRHHAKPLDPAQQTRAPPQA
ncbi:hypothetical protein ACOTTU_07110 [Roseobacter sp. EG26]|uniref:hypothetical protein n=1 Tax=Roseobacter sp. EG26 TaxID=3412477 RepID=UPI003CE48729